MTIVALKDISNLKDKDPIEAVEGRISKVFKARQWQGKNVQDAEIQDASGLTVKLSVWDHPDLGMYEGTDVIIQSSGRGGVLVKYDDYKKTNVISVGKAGTFQKLAVHKAQVGGPADPVKPFVQPPQTVHNGAKVGMAINCSTQFMVNSGQPFDEDKIWELASSIIRVSNKLESGETKQ